MFVDLANKLFSLTNVAYSLTAFVVSLQQHDYRSEQPVTIWTEIRDRAHVSKYSVTYCTVLAINMVQLQPALLASDLGLGLQVPRDHFRVVLVSVLVLGVLVLQDDLGYITGFKQQ